jgi:benzodiazapine receptor
LAVNAIWSWAFFAWRLGAWSFADIILLIVLILATIIAFWRIRRDAAMLMAPYLAWVCFAAALNFTLWRSNPGLLS